MHKKIISLLTALIMLFTVSREAVFATSGLEATQIFDVTEQDGNIIYEWNEPESLVPDTKSDSKTQTASDLPAAYSLVSTLPAVRDQGNYGTCWAHAALASLESNLIKKGLADSSIDLSENHLAWFTYNGKNSGTKSAYAGNDTYYISSDPYDIGGNALFATATLARWYGAVSQNVASEAVPLKSSLQTGSEIQIGNVDFLPNPTTDSTRNTLKKYIMSNGAVTISYYHDEENKQTINGKTTYYYDGDEYPNHDVTIVGWDDSVTTEKGQGAWLIRNSYGSEWGDDGYFYLSYYDTALCDPTGITAGTKTKTYNRIYQYDGAGFGDNLFGYSDRVMGANVYTARADERVRAVGTYTIEAGSAVTVKLYLNPGSASPASGTKLYEKTFNAAYAGYHIFDLGKDINIPSGASFSVIVQTCGSDYLIPAEVEGMMDSYTSLEHSKGQSFLYIDGEWSDVTQIGTINGIFELGNVLAKAYTYSAGTAAQTLSGKSSYTKTYGCEAFYLDTKVTSGNGKLYYKSSNTSVATVSSSGKVTVKKPGKVTITVMAAPNATYKSVTKKITLTVKPKKSTVTKLTSSAKGKLQVKWKKDSTVSGYQVVIAKNKNFTKGKKTAYIKSKNTVSKTFTKLSSKKKYYVKVRAYKTVNGTKIYGPYSSVKTKTVK